MEMQEQMAPLPSCTVCGVTDVLRCAKCKTMYYCSAEHQQIDWPAHRQDCRRLAKEKSNNKMQQLQQAVAAATLTNNLLPDVGTQLNLQQLQNGSRLGASVGTGFIHANNTNAAATAAALPPAISVIMGTNENEILNSQAVSVSQNSNSGYHGNIDANSTTMEQMQFRGGGEGSSVEGVNPDMYFTQDTGLQQPQYPHFSNHNNHLEKSSSYQISRGDEKVTGSANERRYEELCRNIINDLNEYGLSVVDDFLGMEKGLDILNEVHRMYAAGVFQDGQLVNNLMPEQDSRTIRGDKITWVKGVEPGCTNVGYLVNQIDAVICRANTMRNNGKLGDYNIKERTKAMVACYPGSGSHYVVHVDNPNKDGRVITAIYYLNVNWDAKRSGGVLRIFPEHGNTVADIEPKFDRLIFFWSDKRNPHEVQPAHRTRYAITVWYFDAYEREAALNRCKYDRSNEKTTTTKSTTNTLTAKKLLRTAATINNSNKSTSANSNSNINTNTNDSSTQAKANLNKMANSNSNTNPNTNSNSNSANEICT